MVKRISVRKRKVSKARRRSGKRKVSKTRRRSSKRRVSKTRRRSSKRRVSKTRRRSSKRRVSKTRRRLSKRRVSKTRRRLSKRRVSRRKQQQGGTGIDPRHAKLEEEILDAGNKRLLIEGAGTYSIDSDELNLFSANIEEAGTFTKTDKDRADAAVRRADAQIKNFKKKYKNSAAWKYESQQWNDSVPFQTLQGAFTVAVGGIDELNKINQSGIGKGKLGKGRGKIKQLLELPKTILMSAALKRRLKEAVTEQAE
jgi:hypothetical protein